jgi:hypothetical protein
MNCLMKPLPLKLLRVHFFNAELPCLHRLFGKLERGELESCFSCTQLRATEKIGGRGGGGGG